MIFSELSSRRGRVAVPFFKDPETCGMADSKLTQFSSHVWVSASALPQPKIPSILPERCDIPLSEVWHTVAALLSLPKRG